MADIVSSMSVTISTDWVNDMKGKVAGCKEILKDMCKEHQVDLLDGDQIQLKGPYEEIKKMKMALEEWHKKQMVKGNTKERDANGKQQVNGTETGEGQKLPEEKENKAEKRQRKLVKPVTQEDTKQIPKENTKNIDTEQMTTPNFEQSSDPSFEESTVTGSGLNPLNLPSGASVEDEKYLSVSDTWPDQNQNLTGSSLSAVGSGVLSDVQMPMHQHDYPPSVGLQIDHQQNLQYGHPPSTEVPGNMQPYTVPGGQQGPASGFQEHTQQPNHPNSQYDGLGYGQGQQQYPGSYQSGSSSTPQGQVYQGSWNPMSGQNVGWQPMPCPFPPNPNSHPYPESTAQFRLAEESNDSLNIVSNRPHNVLRISIHMGNIASVQYAPIIVSSANSWLTKHGNISEDVLSAAGQSVLDECSQMVSIYGPVQTGVTISTQAGNLYPAVETILHAVIPTADQYSSDTNLGFDNLCRVLHRCLSISTQLGKSIAIPPIGSEISGINKVVEAFVRALQIVDKELAQQHPVDGPTPNEIHFISNDSNHLQTMMYYVKNLLFPPLP